MQVSLYTLSKQLVLNPDQQNPDVQELLQRFTMELLKQAKLPLRSEALEAAEALLSPKQAHG